MSKIPSFEAWRHSIKPTDKDPESQEFTGISKEGVELVKDETKKILEFFEKEKEGSIMFLGGCSECDLTKPVGKEGIRTKSTARVMGQAFKELIVAQNKDIRVLTPDDIADSKTGYTVLVKKVAESIKSNPNKTIVVFPLFLKEFGIGYWRNEEGEYSLYRQAQRKKYGDDRLACLKDWIENEGHIDGIQGPNPTQVARDQLQGIGRLSKFVRKYIGADKPLIIGMVGHSLNLDALAIYLANQGRVDLKGFEKVGGKMIGEMESIKTNINNQQVKLFYNNQEYIYAQEE